jgi:hypothetical protein
MIAIPQWLKTSSDIEQQQQLHRHGDQLARVSREKLAEASERFGAYEHGVPIFCAGGCGEVVGYLPKGHKVLNYKGRGYEHWCPTCEAADISKKRIAASKTPLTSADELAGLIKPVRDLRWLRLIQVATVGVIIAGSVCIARGRVVGIYLAAFGTLAWLATCSVFWKLSD